MKFLNILHKTRTLKNKLKNKLLSLLTIAVTTCLVISLVVGGFLNREVEAQTVDATPPGRFGRMFHGLAPFAPANDDVRFALLDLGKPGGILDAKDDLIQPNAPCALVPNPGPVNLDNPTQTAGTTFFGQFMDHDVTFDETSRLGRPIAPLRLPNTRTAAFDLDTLYGRGPFGGPLSSLPPYYNPGDPVKLKVESGGVFEDVPRNPTTMAAIIADPRNDQHMMMTGLTTAFSLFHNRAVDEVRSQFPGISSQNAFNEARKFTTWHYQWLILHEFLPQIIGQDRIDDILNNGRKFYNPLRGFIPVEFSVGYRFAHSMVRPSYRANLQGNTNPSGCNSPAFFGLIFDPSGSQEGRPDPEDLRGGARASRRFIGWQTFFQFNQVVNGQDQTNQIRRNKRIDTHISTPLLNLPLQAIPGGAPPTSLMQRNLLRHLTFGLPSGQDLARTVGVPVLTSNELSELDSIYPTFDTSTPMWYYILKEAELKEEGLRLGALGSRIIGEVIIGLLQVDPNSYLRVNPNWLPTVPTATGNPADFRMRDFLTFARVDPLSRGQ